MALTPRIGIAVVSLNVDSSPTGHSAGIFPLSAQDAAIWSTPLFMYDQGRWTLLPRPPEARERLPPPPLPPMWLEADMVQTASRIRRLSPHQDKETS
jgi:hypothetical protein